MDTTGVSESINLRGLLKSSAQLSPVPTSATTTDIVEGPTPAPVTNEGPTAILHNSFTHHSSNSHDASSGSFAFPPQWSVTQQYVPLEQALWQSHVFAHHQRSSPLSIPPSVSLHARSISQPPNPVDSARLMTLLNFPNRPSPLTSGVNSEIISSTGVAPAVPSAPSINLAPNSGSGRALSANLPKGRRLKGVHVVYDIDVHLPGEAQPQLEVTPITMYISDPVLFVGRQIAVNRNYICYGLRPNRHIRILNIHTASRSLLRGHSERVTDMIFFSDDAHLLASASSDGRVFVRKIVEGTGDGNKLQITDRVILAVQFMGSWESVYPRVCWFNHAEDILVVGINKFIFVVDIPKVRQLAAPNGFTTEDPVLCNVDNPVEGFCCVAVHDDEITGLSATASHLPMLASASKDGTIRIWKDQNMNSISSFSPHGGQEVGAVAFLTAPHCSDHIVLLSAGRLNHELKLWVPDTEDGWFPKSEPVQWKCMQTLELKSSAEGKPDDAFFNQVLVLPRAHTILLANAKKNSLYVLHLNFGRNPASTHLDYLAEFSVVWPILSFTATCEDVYDGHGIVQIYCVQTQKIQQYSLDLSQCLPPIGELQKNNTKIAISTASPASTVSDESSAMHANLSSSISCLPITNMSSKIRSLESADSKLSVDSIEQQMKEISSGLLLNKTRVITANEDEAITCLFSPRERTLYNVSHDQCEMSGGNTSYAKISISPEKCVHDQRSPSPKPLFPSLCAKEPAIQELQSVTGLSSHLVTPSELMSMVAMSRTEGAGSVTSSPDNGAISKEMTKEDEVFDKLSCEGLETLMVDAKEVTDRTDLRSETKVALAESCILQEKNMEMCSTDEGSEKNFTREFGLVDEGILILKVGEEAQFKDDNEPAEQRETFPRHIACETSDIKQENNSTVSAVLPVRKKKNKNKTETSMSASMGLSSLVPISTLFPSVASTSQQESNNNINVSSATGISDQLTAINDSLSQLLGLQNEFQKQIPAMLAVPVAKEVKRIEAVLGQRMEKVLKAHMDALWARLQEDNAKCEKLEREWVQQLNSFLSNTINAELPAAVERALKKEFTSLGPFLARVIAPNIEKAVPSAINEAFQKGINEKGVTQLEKSINEKIEASLSRQLQAQFQISGKQALQEGLRLCLEGSVIPAFETACRTMFTQIDAVFHKGLADQASAQQQVASSHAALTASLQDAVASASSIAASLKGELVDNQRRVISLIETAGLSRGAYIINGNLPEKAVTVQHVEESLDPTKELARLIAERKLEEAFNKALALTNIGIVSWLCNQVDIATLLTTTPPPLSQGVLLALVQQLGCDLGNDPAKKLLWIKDAALALNPHDSGLPTHVVRHFLEQLYTNLHALLADSKLSADLRYTTRLVIHVVNSLLTAYK